MITTLPLPLPQALVDLHRIDLTARYSTGWGVRVDDVAAAPSGDTYVLYGIHRHTRFRRDDQPDPAVANFAYRLITRYRDGVPAATAVCCSPRPDGTPSAVANGSDMTLAVLPDGTLAVSARPDCTTLISPDLSQVTATFATRGRQAFEDFVPGDPFATSIGVTPSGRLLCATTEYGVHRFGYPSANIVGLADGPLAPGVKPLVKAIASLDPAPARQTTDDLRPHVVFRGAPVGLENRPRPSFSELLAPEDPLSRWDHSFLGRPCPLKDDLFVVPIYAKIFRGGNLGQPFVFALISEDGSMTGRLLGMDARRDSPFTGFCFNIATDTSRQRAFHLNRHGLYAWDADGRMRARLDTATPEFRALTRFTLTACSPAGDLLLVHNTQHLITQIPAPEDLSDLATAVEAALRTYAQERRSLKKAWSPISWHWVQPAAQIHWL